MATGDQVMGRLGFIARYLRPCKRNLDQVCFEDRGLILFLRFIELGLNSGPHKSKPGLPPPGETCGLFSAGARTTVRFFDCQYRGISLQHTFFVVVVFPSTLKQVSSVSESK